MFTKHHPHGGGILHCDSDALEQSILRHQQGDPNALSEIVKLIQPRAETLIRFFDSARYSSESELLSDIHHKLVRSVDRFNAQRGSAFSFISCLIENELRSSVSRARTRASRQVAFDEELANQLITPSDSQTRDAIADVAHKIRSETRTTITVTEELETMRWYVESFLGGAFELRRHQCAGAAQVVHGLSSERARQLYDLALLECRRVMHGSLPPWPAVEPSRLIGRREAWMLRYLPLMNAAEFSKRTDGSRG